MRKPIEDKNPLAAWATLSREGAGMSVEEVVAALGERGHAVTAATIRGIEGGSKGASVRLRRLLAQVYGVNAPGISAPSDELGGGVAAAIDRQTAALTALFGELRVDREARLRALEAAVALLAHGAGAAHPAPDVPPVGAGSGR